MNTHFEHFRYLLALPPHCSTSICRVCRQKMVSFKTVFIRVIYAKPTSNNRWDSVKVWLSFKQTHAGHPAPATGLQTDNSSVLPAIITMRWYLVCLKQTEHKTALWCRNIQTSWTLQVFSFSQMHVTDHLRSLMNFIVCIQIHRDIFMIACRFGGENWQFFSSWVGLDVL